MLAHSGPCRCSSHSSAWLAQAAPGEPGFLTWPIVTNRCCLHLWKGGDARPLRDSPGQGSEYTQVRAQASTLDKVGMPLMLLAETAGHCG